jgi:hypothetical protein
MKQIMVMVVDKTLKAYRPVIADGIAEAKAWAQSELDKAIELHMESFERLSKAPVVEVIGGEVWVDWLDLAIVIVDKDEGCDESVEVDQGHA